MVTLSVTQSLTEEEDKPILSVGTGLCCAVWMRLPIIDEDESYHTFLNKVCPLCMSVKAERWTVDLNRAKSKALVEKAIGCAVWLRITVCAQTS